uniref:SDR family NAD(P)-dependent oxidoreductase n=1 Tax=Macrostomum lignano TaxID=282301 RepID=A0A1I8H7W1_9PLAT
TQVYTWLPLPIECWCTAVVAPLAASAWPSCAQLAAGFALWICSTMTNRTLALWRHDLLISMPSYALLAAGLAAMQLARIFVRNCELVLQQSIWSSIIAARLASRYLRPGGLLTLSGAQAAASGGATPGMIGYGLAKAAVHQLTADRFAGRPKSGLPEGATVLALLPATLDTPANRRAMGDAKASGWTPLEFVADLLHSWLVDKDARPPSGSLLALVTRDSVTEVKPVTAA